MKAFSLILTSLFFITQTVALAGLPSKDARQALADQLRQRGVELQRIADSEGVEAIEARIDQAMTQALDELSELRERMIDELTDEEATEHIKTFKKLFVSYNAPGNAPGNASGKISGELDHTKINLILNDRGLTAKEQVTKIAYLSTYKAYKETFKKIKEQARDVGYEKTLSEIAHQLSSRDYESKERKPVGPDMLKIFAAFILIGGVAFVLGYFTALAFPKYKTAAYLFWGICGFAAVVGA